MIWQRRMSHSEIAPNQTIQIESVPRNCPEVDQVLLTHFLATPKAISCVRGWMFFFFHPLTLCHFHGTCLTWTLTKGKKNIPNNWRPAFPSGTTGKIATTLHSVPIYILNKPLWHQRALLFLLYWIKLNREWQIFLNSLLFPCFCWFLFLFLCNTICSGFGRGPV